MTGTVGTASDTSPEALLKQAVMGARPAAKPAAKPAPTPAVAPAPRMRRIDPRLAGLVGAALLVGAGLGAGAVHLGATAEDRAALAQLQHRLGTAQAETDRIAAALAQLGKGVAQVQDSTDAARGEARTRGTALMERVARSEQALAAKLGALNERVDQGEKDHAGRLAALTAQVEKRAAAPAPVPVAAKAVSDKAGSDKAVEPTETGALADKAPAAPKPPASDNWAVREVYDGIAVLEDRKRRLVEVAIGDTVPGVGRVETIERRGRAWAVVTRQGVITPQTW